MSRNLPTDEQLENAWVEVQRVHREHLNKHGVRLPTQASPRWIWLAMLFHFRPGPVHKNEVSDAVRRAFPAAAPDQQVRHLKREGWNIEGESPGAHVLADPFRPSSEFVSQDAHKRKRVAARVFDDLKTAYGHRCATCGATEGEPDPRYGGPPVRLQRGHKDPDGPGDDLRNIIPQCGACNQAYRGDFVFDDKGRVRAVADLRPVKKARARVRRRIRDFLNERSR